MPYLKHHLPAFEASGVNFVWHLVHGAAANTNSTRWCALQQPRLSRDGSSEFINSISKHPRVRVYQKQWWAGGKDEMMSAPLPFIKEPALLWQVDIDELYTPDQIKKIVQIFEERRSLQMMSLKCRYYYGQDIFVVPESDKNNHWLRLWRWRDGMKLISHEPPNLDGNKGEMMSSEETAKLGLIFEHRSWDTEQAVSYKANFYRYRNALSAWKRLQQHKTFPCKARDFFYFASPSAVLTKL